MTTFEDEFWTGIAVIDQLQADIRETFDILDSYAAAR